MSGNRPIVQRWYLIVKSRIDWKIFKLILKNLQCEHLHGNILCQWHRTEVYYDSTSYVIYDYIAQYIVNEWAFYSISLSSRQILGICFCTHVTYRNNTQLLLRSVDIYDIFIAQLIVVDLNRRRRDFVVWTFMCGE